MGGYLWPWPAGTRGQDYGAHPESDVNPPGGHTGKDGELPMGTPLRAPAAGVIEYAREFTTTTGADNPYLLTGGGGKTVVLNCGANAPSFVLAHLSAFKVREGQRVAQGQVLALSGNSGWWTTGPHCHFEALPPAFDINSNTYGRVNPATYCRDYYTPGTITTKGAVMPSITATLAQIATATKGGVWAFSGARPGGKPITMWNRIVSTHEMLVKLAADVAAIRAELDKDK